MGALENTQDQIQIHNKQHELIVMEEANKLHWKAWSINVFSNVLCWEQEHAPVRWSQPVNMLNFHRLYSMCG